ncbi:hypothetical protein [Acidimangrovimonas sediminis]|uniref:hypothetical protein n=1 Tax=Acidimangrovimonas sediminis TaxID=2056283 RepID=UPI0011AF8CA7|nr:hypothetical protein [Acidimangrovimonas sediminis]
MNGDGPYLSRDQVLTRTNLLGFALLLSFVYEEAYLSFFLKDLIYLTSVKTLIFNAIILFPFLGGGAFLLVDVGHWLAKSVKQGSRFHESWFFRFNLRLLPSVIVILPTFLVLLFVLGANGTIQYLLKAHVWTAALATFALLYIMLIIFFGLAWRLTETIIILDRYSQIRRAELIEMSAYFVVAAFIVGLASALFHRGVECKFMVDGQQTQARLIQFLDNDVVAKQGDHVVVFNRAALKSIDCLELGHRDASAKE